LFTISEEIISQKSELVVEWQPTQLPQYLTFKVTIWMDIDVDNFISPEIVMPKHLQIEILFQHKLLLISFAIHLYDIIRVLY
jgi:hypothetical protein